MSTENGSLELSAAPSTAHLERDLQLISRYAFVHSRAPFRSRLPFVGALKNAARAIMRGLLSFALGDQDRFNAAVAAVLFEFTRRAASNAPLEISPDGLEQVLRTLDAAPEGAQAQALTLLAREVRLLQDQVRAAELSAAVSERQCAELARRVDELERARPARPGDGAG